MIISASRRTDIPAFYSDWFINRLKEEFVLVPNPRNPKKLSRINLSPQIVDCIVFWSKNPTPLIDKLKIIDDLGYNYYFQFTLTPYGKDIEKNLPDKNKLLESLLKISEKIGPKRLVWRYDPVILNEKYNIKWHIKNFSYLCSKLQYNTRECVFSFLDLYNCNNKLFKSISSIDMNILAKNFSQIAKSYNILLKVCAEKYNFDSYNIKKSSCISHEIIEDILGQRISSKKDQSQRALCNCIKSIDIGSYNTCKHNCMYCYANNSKKLILENIKNYNPKSPMLNGYPNGNETITLKKEKSDKINQLSFFDLNIDQKYKT